MGPYLSMLVRVINSIYADNKAMAAQELKKLLNCLNADFRCETNQVQKQKLRNSIVTLLPVLDGLKKGIVDDVAIKVLNLDKTRLPGYMQPQPVQPVQQPAPQPQVQTPPESDFFADLSFDLEVEEVSAQEPASQVEEQKQNKPVIAAKKERKKSMSPLYLSDYIGQAKAKEGLEIAISAAKKQNRCLEHLLICSSYGLGKTTLANIIANEMDMPFFTINATNLKDAKSLSLFFSKIKENCIIFIDEIHSLKTDVQTILLSVMTDFMVSFIDEKGNENTVEVPDFTLIGATTQAGELVKPLINRFKVIELVDYTPEEEVIITKSKFEKLSLEIEDDVALKVAKRARGIPRTIENFAKGMRDLALVRDEKQITADIAEKYFEMNDIDKNGLVKNDLLLLNVLADALRPLALVTLESKTGIHREDIEFRYEPYLIKMGLVEKTEKGRIITEKGIEYISGPTTEKEPVQQESEVDSADQDDVQD